VTEKTERDVIEQHTVRSRYGPPRFNDGFPEQGTPEYAALPYGDLLALCRLRAGTPPLPYASENNPIDSWRL
jgi:hypothetical protein